MNTTFNNHILKKFLYILLVLVLLFFSYSDNIEAGSKISSPLVVFGGEGEGVITAVSAARKGINTTLIMERENPGGLITYGYLNYLDLNYNKNGDILNKSIFKEWHNMVGEGISFSIDKAEKSFWNLINDEENLRAIKNAELKKVKMNENNIEEILIKKDNKDISIMAKRYIDASQDGDLAFRAGAPFFDGGADRGLPERHMAVTLVLPISNVDWNKLSKDVENNKYGKSFIDDDHAWGFAELGKMYEPHDLNIRLRGLNIVLAEDNKVYINGMLIFNVDPIDDTSLERAHQRGKKEAVYVLDFLKDKLSGFENAKLLDFPEELYVRESRHLVAEKQLTVVDQFNNKIPWDTMALASYPLDYQASVPGYNGFVLFNPEIYGISFRSMIPKNYKNLLVVGRSSGYSSLAASSARVIPTGMALGESAGVATVYSLKNDINYYQLSKDKKIIKKIQKEILNKSLDNIHTYPIINSEPIKSNLEYLLSWGMAIGGYNNIFRLNNYITEKDFAYLLIKGLQRSKSPILYEWVAGSLESLSTGKELKRDKACELLLAATSHKLSEIDSDNYFEIVVDKGFMPKYIIENVKKNRFLNRAEVYIVISHFLNKYPLPDDLIEIRGEYGV